MTTLRTQVVSCCGVLRPAGLCCGLLCLGVGLLRRGAEFLGSRRCSGAPWSSSAVLCRRAYGRGNCSSAGVLLGGGAPLGLRCSSAGLRCSSFLRWASRRGISGTGCAGGGGHKMPWWGMLAPKAYGRTLKADEKSAEIRRQTSKGPKNRQKSLRMKAEWWEWGVVGPGAHEVATWVCACGHRGLRRGAVSRRQKPKPKRKKTHA